MNKKLARSSLEDRTTTVGSVRRVCFSLVVLAGQLVTEKTSLDYI